MKRSILTLICLVFVLGSTEGAQLWLPPLHANPISIPSFIRSRITETGSGMTVPDGTYSLTLSIWDQQSGGNMLWSETQVVATEDGLMSASMGEIVPIPLNVLAPDSSDTLEVRYLQWEFDGEVVMPRNQLSGMNYAQVATRLRGDINTNPGSIEISAGDAGDGSTSTCQIELEKVRVTSQSFHSTGESSTFEQFVSADSGILEQTIAQDAEYRTEQTRQITITQDLKSISYPGFLNEVEATRNSSGDTAKYTQILSPDSGYVSDIVLKGSKILENFVHHAHGHLDYLKTVGDPATGDTIEIHDIVSVDSGYSHQLTLSDGSTTTEQVDAADYAVWRSHFGQTSTSGDTATFERKISIDSGIVETTGIRSGTATGVIQVIVAPVGPARATPLEYWVLSTLADGTNTTESSHKSTPLLMEALCSNHTTSGDTARIEELVSGDSGITWNATQKGSGYSSYADITLKRGVTSASAAGALKTIAAAQTDYNYMTDTQGSFNSMSRVDTTSGDTSMVSSKADANGSEIALHSASTSDGTSNTILFAEKLAGPGIELEKTKGSKNTYYVGSANGGVWKTTDGGAGTTSGFSILADSIESSRAMSFVHNTSGDSTAVATSVKEGGVNSSIHHFSGGDTDGVEMAADSTGSRLSLSHTSSSSGHKKWCNLQSTNQGLSTEFHLDHVGAVAGTGIHMSSNAAAGGRVGINSSSPTEALHVVGNICATGTIGTCSDERYKENIHDIDNAIDVIEHLRGVKFNWKQNEFSELHFADGEQIGLVAQEVKKVLPSIVSQGSDGYYSIDYAKLTPMLIEAIKAQQKKISELEATTAKINVLEEKLNMLLSK